MIEFLAGAVAMAFLLVSVFFLRFWRSTRDRLFLHFSGAFMLFALNQTMAVWLGEMTERSHYTYILRVLGYGMILFAIVDKNVLPPRKSRSAPASDRGATDGE